MTALTVIYGDPDPVATIEQHRDWDPVEGFTREAYLWDCHCGARDQAATIDAAKTAVRMHLRAHELVNA